MDGSIDRQQLYELVWSEPISKLADQFGYSGAGLAKLCRRYGIPLPSRGHWAKVHAGHKTKNIPLPAPGPDQQDLVLSPISEAERLSRVEQRQHLEEARSLVATQALPSAQPELHPLARAARTRLKQRDGWKDSDHVRSAPSEVLDIRVARASIDRATAIASSLVGALERLGGVVGVDKEKGRTTISLAGARLGLEITEQIARTKHEATPAEKRALERYRSETRRGIYNSPYPQIPQYDYTPTGVLTVSASGWPNRNWRDSKTKQLEQRLDAVVAGIAALAREVDTREREQLRKQQEHERKVKAYEEVMAGRARERQAFEKLVHDANQFAAATTLRNFIEAVEQTAAQGEFTAGGSVEWIAWAKQKANWLDPLCQVSDSILDAPEPEKPGYWWG